MNYNTEKIQTLIGKMQAELENVVAKYAEQITDCIKKELAPNETMVITDWTAKVTIENQNPNASTEDRKTFIEEIQELYDNIGIKMSDYLPKRMDSPYES